MFYEFPKHFLPPSLPVLQWQASKCVDVSSTTPEVQLHLPGPRSPPTGRKHKPLKTDTPIMSSRIPLIIEHASPSIAPDCQDQCGDPQRHLFLKADRHLSEQLLCMLVTRNSPPYILYQGIINPVFYWLQQHICHEAFLPHTAFDIWQKHWTLGNVIKTT